MSAKTTTIGAIVMSVLLNSASILSAQSASSPPVTYRLIDGSTFQQGCLPPCACPAIAPAAVRGTFNLGPPTVGPLFTTYAVTNVAWQTVWPTATTAQTVRLVGSGTYQIGGEVAVTQELILDLSINGATPIHFDSGIVPGGNLSLIDIAVYNRVAQCTGTMIHVRAQPLPAPPSIPYYLDKRSTYQEGCFGPCACPAGLLEPVLGTFILTPAAISDSLYRYYTVSQVNWTVVDSTGKLYLTGSGTYKVGGEFAITHQLVLDLSVDGATPIHLDSGLVPGGGEFPAIDIVISTDPTQCIGTVISVHARPLGDFDLDGVVSVNDVAHFAVCLSGPALAQADATCQDADLDGDGFVDQADFGMLQLCMTGDDQPATVNCGN